MSPEGRGPVVLLHGLARSAASMRGLGRFLERHGYAVHLYGYPSRRATIVEAARQLSARIVEELGPGPLAAVTHSLGGVLVRHMTEGPRFSRVVMLAPPNRGSRTARGLHELGLFRWFYGPAGVEVATADGWPAPPGEVGVIAGTRIGLNPTGWYTALRGVFGREEPHDGTLAVDETRLEGASMVDFATVRASHTFIMNNREARALVLRFLEAGRFTAVGV